jgi:hypothetical protein
MKAFLVSAVCMFISLAAFAEDKIEHQCVANDGNTEITKVLIVYSPTKPYGTYTLEAYKQNDLILKSIVEYGDDMTYIAYFNHKDAVVLTLDWPVPNDRGEGLLEMGYDANGAGGKRYQFDCSTP